MTRELDRASFVTTPRPRDVPGYEGARASGKIPVVSPTPPSIAVRPTASEALRDVAVGIGALVVACLVVLLVGQSDGRLPWPTVGVLLTVTAVGVVVVARLGRRWGRAQVAELQRGYTTTTFRQGAFWLGGPGTPGRRGIIGWDWDATWVLRRDGTVVSPPAGDGDPPGLYPSPRDPDRLELWTGHQWTTHFPEPPR